MTIVRPAVVDEVDELRAIAVAAYEGYVARIGREPAPMTADYDRAVRDGRVWVAVDGGVVAMAGNLAYYPRRGYVETHRAVHDGFRRVFFRKAVTA